MKRATSLLLAIVLCLSLCACGGGNGNVAEGKLSKEELLSSAKVFNRNTYMDDCRANLLRAEEKYVGKIFKLTGVVKEINVDSCVLYNDVIVPLDKDTLKKLTVDKSICIVGRVGEIKHEEITMQAGLGTATTHYYYLVMDQAYYLGDISEFSGTVCAIHRNGAVLKFDDEFGAVYCEIYTKFTDEQLARISDGDSIRISGTITRVPTNDTWLIHGKTITIYYNIYNTTLLDS